jgi:cytochrome c oxidase subunit 3
LSFFKKITAQPWREDQIALDNLQSGGAVSSPDKKVGLWIFIGVVTGMFSLFVVAYRLRMQLADWQPLPEPSVLWINTVMLILSSIALQRARTAARRGNAQDVKFSLIAGGVFALLFLAGQLLAWQQLADLGYFLETNPAYAFFYLLTALHGLHLLGGLWVWGGATARALRGVEPGEVRSKVELCTTYWHYLLGIWLVLFGLLVLT